MKGRLFQQFQLAWFRDAQTREDVQNAIVEARLSTFDWGGPYLPEAFTTEDLLPDASSSGRLPVIHPGDH